MSKKHTNPILEAAKTYRSARLAVFPVDIASKSPLTQWGKYRERFPAKEDIEEWFSSPSPDLGLAVVCGKGSGNIEVIDFDLAGLMFPHWQREVMNLKPNLYAKLLIERSQSGGYHVVYRCSRTEIMKSTKLAYPDQLYDGKRRAGIETKGEGGYYVCAPSPGYVLLKREYSRIPDIAPEERHFLIKTAKSLTEWVDPNKLVRLGKSKRHFSRLKSLVEDAYGPLDEDLAALLKKRRWKLIGKENRNVKLYRAPGETEEYSASLIGGTVLQCLTDHARPFEIGKAYSLSAAFLLLELNALF